jgi:phosphoglycerate dehydrogenase-like enzyme
MKCAPTLASPVLRVALTNDFAPGNMTGDPMREPLEEILGPLPGLEWEFLPEVPALRAEDLAGYDAVIVGEPYVTADSIRGLERLALIAYWGIGVNKIDVAAATENDVLVSNSPSPANHSSVAETVLTFMLALSKQLFAKDRLTREGRALEAQQLPGALLEGRVIGTIGLGATARRLVELLQPFRLAAIRSFDPYVSPEAAAALGVELVPLETVMRESDYVAVMCTLTEDTRGLVSADLLRLMKPTAYLLNAARGPIVDEAALVRALEEGWIAGAGLDVFEREPPARNEPILAFDNAIATGHAMAWTAEALRGACVEPCRAVARVYEGREPEHVVNRDVVLRPGFQAKLERIASAVRSSAAT